MVDNTIARLQRLEDLDAIRQLFVDYGYHLDRGDFDAYSKLFADDGEVLMGPMGRARGPQAIKALMSKALEGRIGTSYHLIANPIINLDGDQANSTVTWAVIARSESDGPSLTMIGRHVDKLIRERGTWKFLRREGHVDIPSKFTRPNSK